MRNLKRALSLALASVMLLGMMVVGTSAASYPDVKDSDNVEAIEVLNAVGVMVGDRGNFRPDSPVNRHEMAAIMARLILGEDAETYVGTHPFTDVYPWADKYVAACYENGIINGTSKTTFSGNQPLTAIQAATMMLRALGYEHLTRGASDWRVPVAAQANKIGLFKGVTSSPSAQLTRNQVAQLALNTLESDMVEFTGTLGFEVNGVSIGDQLKWDARKDLGNTTNNGYNYTNDSGTTHQKEYLQLLEDLYDGQLKKASGTDNFGRPTTKWTYKAEEINVAKDNNVIFTAKTSAANVAKALKGYKIDNDGTSAGTTIVDIEDDTTHASLTIAGVKVNNGTVGSWAITSKTLAKAIADETENGKAVEIYANSQNVIEKIVVLSYKVAEVSAITESKDGNYRKTAYAFKGVTNADLNNNYQTFTDPSKDDKIILHGDIAKDDVVTILALAKETHVYPTTQITGQQSALNTGDKTITVSGTTYTVATGVVDSTDTAIVVNTTNFPNADKDYDYYLDQFGYVVKGEAVESNDYAVIDAIRWTQETTALDQDGQAAARLIFPDGHTENVVLAKLNGKGFQEETTTPAITDGTDKNKVDSTQADNGVFEGMIVTYTKKDNGKYEVTQKTTSTTGAKQTVTGSTSVGTDTTVITKGVPAVYSTTVTGNDNTVYILKTKDGSDNVYTAYTGYQNMPTVKLEGKNPANTATVSYVFEKNSSSVASYVFIDATKAKANTNETGNMVYIMDAAKINIGGTSNDKFTYLEAALNGEKKEVTFDSTANAQVSGEGLYKVEINNKGEVTKATVQTNLTVADFEKKTLTADAGKGVVDKWTYKGGEKVWIVDGTEIFAGSVDDAQKNDTVFVKVVDSNATGADKVAIKEMYIVRPDSAALTSTAVTVSTVAPTTASTADNPSATATVDTAAGTIAIAAKGIYSNAGTADTLVVTMSLPANAHVGSKGSGITSLSDTSITLTRGASDWGSNLTFVVTAADGTTTQTYTITVTETSQATKAASATVTSSTVGLTGASASVGSVSVNASTGAVTAAVTVTAPTGGTPAANDTLTIQLKNASGGNVGGTMVLTYNGTSSAWEAATTGANSTTETTDDTSFVITWTAST